MSCISSQSSVRHTSGKKKILVGDNQITYNFFNFISSFLQPTSVVFLKLYQINYFAHYMTKHFRMWMIVFGVNSVQWRFFICLRRISSSSRFSRCETLLFTIPFFFFRITFCFERITSEILNCHYYYKRYFNWAHVSQLL